MEDDRDHHRNPPPEMICVCKECGKGFRSPQGLACHKRIHKRPVKQDKNLERTLQPRPGPAPVPVRPSYRSSSLTLSLGDEHGDQYPTGRNDLSATEVWPPPPPPVRPSYCSTSLTLSLGDEHGDQYPTGRNDLSATEVWPPPPPPVRPSYCSTSLTLSLGDEHGDQYPTGRNDFSATEVWPAPAPVRPSYCSTSLTLSLGDEHGVQYPAGRNDLLATEGLWAILRDIVKRSIPSAVAEYFRAKDMNRGDQEDDKMNQGANDLQLFDKMPQPNREGPESAVNRRDKRKLDDESKDSEFFFDQAVGEPKASLNDNWWPSGYNARTPLDWGTGGEGSSNDNRWPSGYKARTPLDWGTRGEGRSNDNMWPWGQYKASTPLDWGTGGEGSSNDNRWPSGQYKANTPLDWGTRGEGSSNAAGGGGLIINDAEAEQHKCNRCWSCGSNFPTGQALGEHRCHHSTGSPAGNSSQGTGEGIRPVLDLDLNEPPPASVEDSQVNVQSDSVD